MTRILKQLWWLPLLSSFLVLGFVAWINRYTPYRGEHWAVMNAYLNSPDGYASFKNVLNFECFGNHRFQPLTFFASLVPYWLFKQYFFFHYLFTSLLHVIYVHALLVVIHFLNKNELKLKGLFKLYNWEASLLLVSFFASDVITWSMYVYLQLAAIGVFYGIAIYSLRRELASFLLLSLATLLYEPAYGVLTVLVVNSLVLRRAEFKERLVGAFCVFVLGFSLFQNYQLHVDSINPIVQAYSGLLDLSLFQKLMWVCIKGSYILMTISQNIIFPQGALLGNIFELQFSVDAKPYLIIASWTLTAVLFYLGLKNSKLRLILLSAVLLFGIIAWGRSDRSPYVVRQFRYAYILSGFLLTGAFGAGQHLKARYFYGYRLFFLCLILLHSKATLTHGIRVEESMRPVASYFQKSGNDAKKSVKATNEAISYGTLSVPKELSSFVYNANSCMYQWLNWLKG